MALIALPATLPIRKITWSFKQPGQMNRSSWTGRRQFIGSLTGFLWTASIEFVPQIGATKGNLWKQFFTRLQGQQNTFAVPVSAAAQHGSANPNVSSGGAAGATTLVASATVTALKAGMFLTVKLSDGTYQLVQLTSDVASTTYSFLPPLRLAAATGAGSLETVNPYCVMQLNQDTYTWSEELGQIYNFAFDAEESY